MQSKMQTQDITQEEVTAKTKAGEEVLRRMRTIQDEKNMAALEEDAQKLQRTGTRT